MYFEDTDSNFSQHFLKTWAFPASLTICYRHLGMGPAYYNLLCDSLNTLWASSYSTSSSTKFSSALIRPESELPESPLHTCICKLSRQFNLCATCTQVLAEVTVVTWKAEMRWYPHALKKAVPVGQGVSLDKDALQEVRQQKYRMCTCHTLTEQCYHFPTTCKHRQTEPDGDSVHLVFLKGFCFH